MAIFVNHKIKKIAIYWLNLIKKLLKVNELLLSCLLLKTLILLPYIAIYC